jgi:hypothetical protein
VSPAGDAQPAFIFSLPRSGSTLLQRVLAAHTGIATASEPWLLLPLLGPLRPKVPNPGAWVPAAGENLEDFARLLPAGVEDYEAAVREAALRLYRAAAPPGTRWFLDKSPPYYLIAEEVMRTFPDARFLFLWRHPLSVVASIVETFTGGVWKPGDYVSSLFVGVENLTAAAQRADGRALSVRFEDLVTGDVATWERVLAHLGGRFEPEALERFSGVRLEGRMGDPTGVHRYQALSEEPLTKWRAFVSNPLRRAWCARYLRWIGAERLAVMGYELDRLLAELDEVPVTRAGMGSDLRQLGRALARDTVKAQVIRPRPPTSFRYLTSG